MLIIGAGPAGLVLANLLCAAGIDCVVLDRRSRPSIERQARAGFLSPDSVSVLREHGLDAGLAARGTTHDLCEFRSPTERFELHYGQLGTGRPHTVYPQQLLVSDLVAELLRRGGTVRFETEVSEFGDLHTDRPWVLVHDSDGRAYRYTGRYLAGCDGAHGVARDQVPAARAASDHGITWLALLAQAPPTSSGVLYGVHPDGFAGQMPRSSHVTRYYLQWNPYDSMESWDERRIWKELARRLDAERCGSLSEGPIIERSLVRLRSEILDRIQHGQLFLVGDAATSISPCAAKGANLAIVEARLLARALVEAIRDGDGTALQRYSTDCLPLIRRAQEFSHRMIDLLHPPTLDDPNADYQRILRQARLHNLATSRNHQNAFANDYVGMW